MINREFIENCLVTENKDYESIGKRVSHTHMIRLLHGAMILATESIELLDAVKKHVFYGKFIDIVNIEEELGDAFYGMALIMDAMKIDPDRVMDMNTKKLKKRYGDKFSEKAAIERDVESERKELERMHSNMDGHKASMDSLEVAKKRVEESDGRLSILCTSDGMYLAVDLSDHKVENLSPTKLSE